MKTIANPTPVGIIRPIPQPAQLITTLPSMQDAADFKSYDLNRDGKVTQDEFVKARKYEREFEAKDRNHDGKLSRLELNGFQAVLWGAQQLAMRCIPPSILDRFFKFDDNHDGAVSKGEYMSNRNQEETFPIFRQPTYFNAKSR